MAAAAGEGYKRADVEDPPRLSLRRRAAEVRDRGRQLFRAARTVLGVADVERWRQTGRERPVWDDRNDIVASLIHPGASVLDVGCGARTLQPRLPDGCSYQPCDIVAHDEEVWVWNFNEDPFPHPSERYDTVVLSGVLEYAREPSVLLAAVTTLGEELVLSYGTTDRVPSRYERRSAGWWNDLSQDELEDLMRRMGLTFEHVVRWEDQEVYRVSREALAAPPPTAERAARARRVTVCGSFGFHNAGDEAAWMSVSDLVDELEVPARLGLLSRFDEPAMPEIIGLGDRDAYRRTSLRGGPLVYVGGGVVEPADIGVVTATERFLREADVPRYGLLGVNAESGREYPPEVADRLRRILEGAAFVSGRDPISAGVLSKLAPGADVKMTGDVVLWLQPADALPDPVAGLGDYVAVTLAPRWSDEPAFRAWITEQLAGIAKALDAPIVFVPCSTRFDDDRAEHAPVAAALRDAGVEAIELTDDPEPRTLSAVYGASRLTVGMRLHSCVMAWARRTPVIGLTYHPKLRGFAQACGIEEFVVPHRAIHSQSGDAYGYTFADTQLADEDLVALAERALDAQSFDRLEPLKRATADALRTILEV